MKKILAFLSVVFITVQILSAQSKGILYKETFDTPEIPSNMYIMGAGISNWSISNTNFAGGTTFEIRLNHYPIFNGVSRLVLPAIDLTGIDNVLFSFKHFLSTFVGSSKIGIATVAGTDTTWHEGWNQTFSNDNQGVMANIISTEDMNKEDVVFCLFFEGNSDNINEWYIDDIEIIQLENKDAEISDINIPVLLDFGDYDVGFNVSNYGIETINSIKAQYKLNGVLISTKQFDNLNLSTGNNTDLSFDVPFSVELPVTHEVEVELLEINGSDDDILENNKMTKKGSVQMCTTERNPLIEIFTSSTCGPCTNANAYIDDLLNDYPGDYSIIKYQMDYPGAGDPYATIEGENRRAYYGVSSIPAGVVEGELLNYGLSTFTEELLNEAAGIPAPVDISGTYYITGNIINIQYDLISFVDMTDVTVHTVINEKKTTGNVGTNGETEFHHVMMKMIPDNNGSVVSLSSGQVKSITLSQNMSATHVEEMDDLEVVVIVQNSSTKQVYNSKFLYSNTSVFPAPENVHIINNLDNTATLSWTKPSDAEPESYTVYHGNDIVANNITDLSYNFDVEEGTLYVFSVRANYPNNIKSVKIPCFILIDNDAVLEPVSNIVSNEEYKIEWQAPIQNIPYSYNIYVNDELIDNTTETFYIFDVTRNVVDRDAQVCVSAVYYYGESEKECIDVEWLGLNDSFDDVVIYPNPAKDKVLIKGNNIKSVSIYNNIGRMIKHIDNGYEILVSDVPNGMYIMTIIMSDDSVKSCKLIINN